MNIGINTGSCSKETIFHPVRVPTSTNFHFFAIILYLMMTSLGSGLSISKPNHYSNNNMNNWSSSSSHITKEVNAGTVQLQVIESNDDPFLQYRFRMQVDCLPRTAFDACLEFNWKMGGGLMFVPKPIVRCSGDVVTGEGFERLILPVGLRERIVTSSRPVDDRSVGYMNYKVVNPSILTFYPVNYHRGEITFVPSSLSESKRKTSATEIVWVVKVIPMTCWKSFVTFLTKFVIETYLKNLSRYLESRRKT